LQGRVRRMSVSLELAGIKRENKIITIANLNPVSCRTSARIFDAVDTIIQTGHRRLPIVSSKDSLEGIITITDLLDAFLRRQDFSEKLETIMVREVIFCSESDTIDFVLRKIKLSRRGGFPIVDVDKKLVGIVSERDFVKYFSNIPFETKVEDVMSKKPLVVTQEISILDCFKTIVNTRYRRLPVVEGGRLVGIVTSVDLLKYIRDHDYEFLDLDEPIDLIMKRDVFTISKNADLSDAIKIMRTKDIGGILIVNGKNNLEGILTERDILEEID
jgi:CBS domain-containing protein